MPALTAVICGAGCAGGCLVHTSYRRHRPGKSSLCGPLPEPDAILNLDLGWKGSGAVGGYSLGFLELEPKDPLHAGFLTSGDAKPGMPGKSRNDAGDAAAKGRHAAGKSWDDDAGDGVAKGQQCLDWEWVLPWQRGRHACRLATCRHHSLANPRMMRVMPWQRGRHACRLTT